MNDLIKIELQLVRMLLSTIAFFIFQTGIISVSASPSILYQSHHTGTSEIYAYDEIESSVWAEVDHTDKLSRVLSEKGVRPYHEVLAGVASVAARSSTSLVTNYPANAAISGTAMYCLGID